MNIYRIAILYFFLGISLNFGDLAVHLELIDKGITVADLAIFAANMVIPWCLKPLYGLISDVFPILGQRRRPYIVVSNLLACLCWAYMSEENISIFMLKSIMFCISLFTCFSDVMYDSLLVVEAQTERDSDHGKKQSTCWLARAAGATMASFSSGYLLNGFAQRKDIFMVQSLIHFLIIFQACC